MNRLTKQDPTWLNEEFWISAEEPDDERIDDVYLKLREYENTGLTPERVQELAKADKEGLLVVLPCKAKEMAHAVVDIKQLDGGYRKEIESGKIINFRVQDNGVFAAQETKPFGYPIWWNIEKFGKTVFSTREEAEEALNK